MPKNYTRLACEGLVHKLIPIDRPGSKYTMTDKFWCGACVCDRVARDGILTDVDVSCLGCLSSTQEG